ncbi:uncharacterized protein LOC143513839 [Brachyhypopomus gauderio]|uniref:uncharacterized protein LOC143513839 n=1 Tax=Brachyhypopomus gauderio TaxID=698409 RepID=UPI0040412559
MHTIILLIMLPLSLAAHSVFYRHIIKDLKFLTKSKPDITMLLPNNTQVPKNTEKQCSCDMEVMNNLKEILQNVSSQTLPVDQNNRVKTIKLNLEDLQNRQSTKPPTGENIDCLGMKTNPNNMTLQNVLLSYLGFIQNWNMNCRR